VSCASYRDEVNVYGWRYYFTFQERLSKIIIFESWINQVFSCFVVHYHFLIYLLYWWRELNLLDAVGLGLVSNAHSFRNMQLLGTQFTPDNGWVIMRRGFSVISHSFVNKWLFNSCDIMHNWSCLQLLSLYTFQFYFLKVITWIIL